jgi:hypothetical protein
MTSEEAAAWMLEQLERRKFLDQSLVAQQLRKQDKALTYPNANGNPAIVKPVLDAFRALLPDEVVWSRSSRHWRYRKPRDKPGRMQE